MHKRPNQKQQHGVVLLLMLLVLVVTTSSFLLAAINSSTIQQARHQDRILALQTAKESLLAYALHSELLAGEGPGKMPCPDSNNDSLPDCGAFAATTDSAFTGRLPTLAPLINGTSAYRFSDGLTGTNSALWYAVSPDFMFGSMSPLNTYTAAQLTVNNQADYIAAVIAPGQTLGNQTGRGNELSQYLEQENADNDLFFSSASDSPSETGNDIVLGITRDELFLLLLPRVVEAFRVVLSEEAVELPVTSAEFHCTIHYADSTPQWLRDNEWTGINLRDETTLEDCLAGYVMDAISPVNYLFNEVTATAQISFQDFGDYYYCLSEQSGTLATLLEGEC